MVISRVRRIDTSQRSSDSFFKRLLSALWMFVLWVCAIIACLTLIPEMIWLYLYWRHRRLFKKFEAVHRQIIEVTEQCPSPINLDLLESYYAKFLHLLQANNLLRGLVDLRLGPGEQGGEKQGTTNYPTIKDLQDCVIKFEGSYSYPPKGEITSNRISYPSDLLRAAFELKDEEFRSFMGVGVLAAKVEGIKDFKALDHKNVQIALRNIASSGEYSQTYPTLKSRLQFESKYFVPYGFHEYTAITGVVKGFFLRPLRSRPYAAESYLKAIKQLHSWKRCVKMMKNLSDFSGAPEIFWKKTYWKALRKDPLWEQSLAALIGWIGYEQAKSIFFKEVHSDLETDEGEKRLSLLINFPIIELQRAVNKIQAYKLDSVKLVSFTKLLWKCTRKIQSCRGRELNFFWRQSLKLSSFKMSRLRRVCIRTAEKINS